MLTLFTCSLTLLACMPAPLLTQPRPQSVRQTQEQVQRGTVLDAATRRPIEGARVSMLDAATGDTTLGASNANGYFELTNPAGPHVLVVRAKGYATWRGPLEDVDPDSLVTIPLVRGVRVAGRVTDAEGQGVADVPVFLTRPVEDPTPTPFWEVARTDERGLFESPEPVAWYGPGNGTDRLVVICATGTGAVDLAATREAEPLVISLRPALPLEVFVHGAGDTPVVGTRLRAVPDHPDLWGADVLRPEYWTGGRREVERLLMAETDARGRALFPALPRPHEKLGCALIVDQHVLWSAYGPLDTTLDLGPEELPMVHLAGRVVDDEGRPVQGARVTSWLRYLADYGFRPMPEGRTDVEGRYDLGWLGAGDGLYTVRVEVDGFRPERRAALPSGEQVHNEIVLWRHRPLRGRVIDQDGRGVPRVQVVAKRPGRLGRTHGTCATGPEGRFLFEDTIAGPYRLDLAYPGSSSAWWTGQPGPHYLAGGEEELIVPVIRLSQNSGRLEVELRDQSTGEGTLAWWAVVIPRQEDLPASLWNPHSLAIGAGGPFGTALPLGRWVLMVGGEALHPEHVPFELTEAEPVAHLVVEMHYPETANLTGRALFEGGEVPSEAWIRPTWRPSADTSLGAQYFPWSKLEPDGRFHLRDMYEGLLSFEVQAPGFLGQAQVDLPPWGLTDVDVNVARAGVLEFVADDYAPHGIFLFELARPGEPWKEIASRGDLQDEKQLLQYTLPPGDWRWRVSILGARQTASFRNRDYPMVMPFGRAQVVAGEVTRVSVPVDIIAYP